MSETKKRLFGTKRQFFRLGEMNFFVLAIFSSVAIEIINNSDLLSSTYFIIIKFIIRIIISILNLKNVLKCLSQKIIIQKKKKKKSYKPLKNQTTRFSTNFFFHAHSTRFTYIQSQE